MAGSGTGVIQNLGVIGTVDGILHPLAVTLYRNGAVWDLTSYSTPVLKVWEARTRTVVTPSGTSAIDADPTTGIVTYTSVTSDTLSVPGYYEARFYVTPDAGGDPEPAGLFRFSVSEGP